MPSPSRRPEALALLAGVLYAVAAEPLGIGILLFFAPILWLSAVELEPHPPDAKRGAKLGFLVGFGCHVIAFYWAVPLFTEHVPIPLPVALVFAVVVWFGQALPFAFIGAMVELLHVSRMPRALALALAMPLGHALVWTMFPWRPAEITAQLPAFAQVAELGGATPLDVLVVLAGAGVVEGLRSYRRWLVVVGVVALVAPTAYGVVRLREVDAEAARAEVLRVGAVQPNVMQTIKFDLRLAPSHLDNLRRLTERVEREGIDFSVWPETSYPWPLPTTFERDVVGRRGIRHRELVRSPIVFGALTSGVARCDHHNSVFAMDGTGAITGRADKVRLLPFSEQVPFYDYLPFLQRFLPCPGFAPGVGAQTLEVVGHRIGILNCYEDLLPDYALLVARERPAFLLNVTNDGWFLNTSEPHLHHMASQLRAIETRRELLRVTNTGLTGRIDAAGRRRESLPIWERGAMVARMRVMPDRMTPFVRYGDVATPVVSAIVVIVVLVTLVRSRLSGAGRAA